MPLLVLSATRIKRLGPLQLPALLLLAQHLQDVLLGVQVSRCRLVKLILVMSRTPPLLPVRGRRRFPCTKNIILLSLIGTQRRFVGSMSALTWPSLSYPICIRSTLLGRQIH